MNMRSLVVVAVFALTGCGGGGGGLVSSAITAITWDQAVDRWRSGSSSENVRTVGQDAVVQETPNGSFAAGGALAALIDAIDGTPLGDPTELAHGVALIAHGEVMSRVSRAELVRYLEADAADGIGAVERWGDTPPTVRIAAGASQEMVEQTRIVVNLLNGSLPNDWQLTFDPTPVPASEGEAHHSGYITITFAETFDWPYQRGPRIFGYALSGRSGDRINSGLVWIDPVRATGARRIELIAHEVLHTLGRSHVDALQFPDSIMDLQIVPPHAIFRPLDDQALHAVYDRLDPDTPEASIATQLGPWENTSLHVLGAMYQPDGAIAVFGAAVRNGHARPWVVGGPVPSQPLRGSASWSGRLIDLTPAAETVAGAADMTVNLGGLTGTLDFTGLEAWGARQPPGAIGTGRQWLDGDLNYGIAVEDNAFTRTGGDDGKVAGVFLGKQHQGVAGYVDRTDLAAGFGALRNDQ